MRALPTNRKIVSVALLLAVGLAAGCDSESEDDGDLFVGEWAVTGLAINGEDRLSLLTLIGVESVGASFSEDGSFELTVVTANGSTATRGTYAFDDDTITITSAEFDRPLVLEYDGPGSGRIVLSSLDAALLTEISGVDLTEFGLEVERVDVTISRQG